MSEFNPVSERTAGNLPMKETLTVDILDRQWGLAAKAIRQDIISKPEVREKLTTFCRQPVTEALPSQVLSSVSRVDKRVSLITQRYQGLIDYLNLPIVPDEQIGDDLRNARHITPKEAEMIAKRYGYARDTKILALGAEIIEQLNVIPDKKGEIKLPSGIKIGLETSNEEQRDNLLKPHLWEKRRKIHDRVYEISAGGEKYILKEKKTSRHTNTGQSGHVDGITSEDEITIAKQLRETGRLHKGPLSVDWEKPLSFVTYPDGFQFAVFEYEDGLTHDNVEELLASEIHKRKEQFEHEYQSIADLAQKHENNYKAVGLVEPQPERSIIKKLFGRPRESSPRLTFEEFTMVKALRMKRQARELMKESLIQNGYINKDADNYAYRIEPDEELKLTIIGYDFEYFQKVSPEQAEKAPQRPVNFKGELESNKGVNFFRWSNGDRVTRMQKAAYYAMLESEGVV